VALAADGQLDPALWREEWDYWRIHLFWLGELDCDGRLIHRQGGFGRGVWLIDYDDRTTDDDEPGYRLGSPASARVSTSLSETMMT